MDWERAKTTLIIILLLLNAGLLFMNIRLAKSYKMTPSEESIIIEILANNDIMLDCPIPPDGKPLRFLNVAATDWDYEYIKDTFFQEAQDITRTLEEGSIIYSLASANETVTVTNAFDSGFSSLIYHDSAGSGTPESYISLLGERFSEFELQRTKNGDDGETYTYNEILKPGVIFSSRAEVLISESGSVTVSIEKFDFDSYVGGVHEISRADEALLTFMHYKNEKIDGEVTIEDIRLGFAADSPGPEKTCKARPCWRIFVMGQDDPVYIDAVMNTIL